MDNSDQNKTKMLRLLFSRILTRLKEYDVTKTNKNYK